MYSLLLYLFNLDAHNIYVYNKTRHIFNYSIVKHMYSFFENRSIPSSGGWDRERVSPVPSGKKMEIRKCLDDF